MADSSIPVDIFNPGQVFACMGFLEAADVLCGNAEGGFDWSKPEDVQFKLRSDGSISPIEKTLGFLERADIQQLVPNGYDGKVSDADPPVPTETFPGPKAKKMALPIRLQDDSGEAIDIDHWTDESSRNPFKLYAGNRSAYSITCDLIQGKTKNKSLGVRGILRNCREDLILRPFDVCTPFGGSFNFDPRGAWTAIDVGYSPNEHKQKVELSPVVEILAAWGLQHARPDEHETRQVHYGVWGALMPPSLARPMLAGINDLTIPTRKFKFTLDLSGKNKVVTYATEEVA
ncbi:MAG: type I-U CRISPR-associated protein Cas8c [Acidimicrobiaceae bacterium]|nr:type I-U CRISPR-associated protein Cas8c [Acidimicrobiaceae bacterium]